MDFNIRCKDMLIHHFERSTTSIHDSKVDLVSR